MCPAHKNVGINNIQVLPLETHWSILLDLMLQHLFNLTSLWVAISSMESGTQTKLLFHSLLVCIPEKYSYLFLKHPMHSQRIQMIIYRKSMLYSSHHSVWFLIEPSAMSPAQGFISWACCVITFLNWWDVSNAPFPTLNETKWQLISSIWWHWNMSQLNLSPWQMSCLVLPVLCKESFISKATLCNVCNNVLLQLFVSYLLLAWSSFPLLAKQQHKLFIAI